MFFDNLYFVVSFNQYSLLIDFIYVMIMKIAKEFHIKINKNHIFI